MDVHLDPRLPYTGPHKNGPRVCIVAYPFARAEAIGACVSTSSKHPPHAKNKNNIASSSSDNEILEENGVMDKEVLGSDAQEDVASPTEHSPTEQGGLFGVEDVDDEAGPKMKRLRREGAEAGRS